jgi:hypothetical protein
MAIAPRTRRTVPVVVLTVVSAALAALSGVSPAAAAPSSPAVVAPTPPRPAGHPERSKAGVRSTERPTVVVGGRRYAAPDPLLAELPTGVAVDHAYWRRQHEILGRRRAARVAAREAAVPTYAYREREPHGRVGRNDDATHAEALTSLGLAQAHQGVRIAGRLSSPPTTARRVRTREDQGSLHRATRTGVGPAHPRFVVRSRIGDGPHGRSGDRHGDVDVFRVHARAGDTLQADTEDSRIDTVLAVYDTHARLVAHNDDVAGEQDDYTSAVAYRVPRAGTYFVLVAGFRSGGSLPTNPRRSDSGRGVGAQGTYRLRVTVRPVDRDYYAVQLASGDVLAGSLTGAASAVVVHGPGGRTLVGSDQDTSGIYPIQSPLPGGGATFAYVASQPGRYTVSVERGSGDYRLVLETHPEGTAQASTQKVFLDFDGARVNTAIWGGPGVVSLSGLHHFLPRWGLRASDEDAVIDAAVATVERDLEQQSSNPHQAVEVLNSRDDPDPYGQPDVSRVIVGGSIGQSGVPTIGIAESIDPGNYAHQESALLLLDMLSSPAHLSESLNTYLRARSDRVAFVGRVLGSLSSHEIGHLLGSFHTDSGDRHANLMDAGGQGYRRMFGVGPDGVGGTADDVQVGFGVDRFTPDEGFRGLEDTLTNTGWALIGH